MPIRRYSAQTFHFRAQVLADARAGSRALVLLGRVTDLYTSRRSRKDDIIRSNRMKSALRNRSDALGAQMSARGIAVSSVISTVHRDKTAPCSRPAQNTTR